MSADGWRRASNLLCVRLDTLGDVLMTTPAIRALKESAPNRRITLLTSHRGAEIAALVPEIDAVITYEAPWMKTGAPRSTPAPDFEMIARLRQERFDAAVVFTVYSQNPLPAALLCHLAGIPLRLAHCRENPYALLTDWQREPEPEQLVRHEVRRQLDLVAAVGAVARDESLSLSVPSAAVAHVEALLGAIELDPERPWAVAHPGASAASRRYPPEMFADALATLAAQDGWRFLLTGSAGEADLVDEVRRSLPDGSVSLAGHLDLAQMAGLLSLTPLLISNNTGPVHIAAALGTPVVDIYALTNPQHGPWAVPHRLLTYDVPCRNCYSSVCPEGHHACLRGIAPGRVVQAARDLMQEAGLARLRQAGPLPARR